MLQIFGKHEGIRLQIIGYRQESSIPVPYPLFPQFKD